MQHFAAGMSWLAGQAASGLLWAWFISLPILFVFFVSLAWLLKTGRSLSRATKILLTIAPASCIIMLILATAWFWDGRKGYHPEQTEVPLDILVGFAIMALLACVVCIMFARGQRLAASALALPAVWYGFWCYFIAVMAISGQWL